MVSDQITNETRFSFIPSGNSRVSDIFEVSCLNKSCKNLKKIQNNVRKKQLSSSAWANFKGEKLSCLGEFRYDATFWHRLNCLLFVYRLIIVLICSFVRLLIVASDRPAADPGETPGIHTFNPLLPGPHWWSARIYRSLFITTRMTVARSRFRPASAQFDHAFPPRPRRLPALRKRVPERGLGLRRRGAAGRGALAGLGPVQPGLCELGLQLYQPRSQVRLLDAAESQEAPERLHHLD